MKKLSRKYSLFLKLFIVPVLLLAFWFMASLLLNKQSSFSVLTYGDTFKVFKNFDSGALLKENKITGEIVGKDNHLGIVSIKFKDFLADYQRVETILFRIKGMGEKNWYSDKNYQIGVLQSSSPFPFGFLPIADSKGKRYVFEVESTSTNPKNSVTLSKKDDTVFTYYQFPKSEILKSPEQAFNFISKKTINFLSNKDFLFDSIPYLFPLFFYLVFIALVKKPLIWQYVFLIFLNFIYLDSIFLGNVVIPILLMAVLAWVVFLYTFKLKKTATLCMAFALLMIWMFLSYFNVADYSYKLSFWVYVFLTIGIIQIVVENQLNEKI